MDWEDFDDMPCWGYGDPKEEEEERNAYWKRKGHDARVWYENATRSGVEWLAEEDAKRGFARQLRKYHLTPEVYNTLLDGQGFVCAICAKPDGATKHRTLHVDHDHSTGWVRGLLCRACNVGLGNFSDDIERLQRAIEYLKFHNREGSLPINQRRPTPCALRSL